MNLASRIGAWAKTVGWVNPYVTDGLVAMWDGEWNAGPGVHDPNATTWRDLVNGYHLDAYDGSSCDWGSDNALFSGQTMLGRGPVLTSEFVTVEIITDIVTTGNNVGIFSIFDLAQTSPDAYRNKRMMARIAANQLYITGDAAQYGTGITGKIRASIIKYLPITDRVYKKTKLYSEGEYEKQFDAGYMMSSGSDYSVGKCPIDSGFGSGLNGKVYCIRVYNRELSASEIAANYVVDKARFGLT